LIDSILLPGDLRVGVLAVHKRRFYPFADALPFRKVRNLPPSVSTAGMSVFKDGFVRSTVAFDSTVSFETHGRVPYDR